MVNFAVGHMLYLPDRVQAVLLPLARSPLPDLARSYPAALLFDFPHYRGPAIAAALDGIALLIGDTLATSPANP